MTIVVLGAFGVLAIDTLRRLVSGREPAGPDRIFGISGTPGFHLAAWGIALTVLAAPIDDLWHRLFGLDVTLWSPPHLLGLLGFAINAMHRLRPVGRLTGNLYSHIHQIFEMKRPSANYRG